MVAPPYAWWIDQYRDEPSQQAFGRIDLGDSLWPRRPPGWSLQPNLGAALIEEAADPPVGARRDMEEWCTDQADAQLEHRGIVVDESDRRKLAWAVTAVMQRASLIRKAAAQGESLDVVQHLIAPQTFPSSAMAAQPYGTAPTTLRPEKLSALVEAWWLEAERTGKSVSTHAAHAHAFHLLIAFLGPWEGAERDARDLP